MKKQPPYLEILGVIAGAFFFIWLFSGANEGNSDFGHGRKKPSPTPTPAPAPAYVKGVWSSMGAGNTVPPGLVSDRGIVGIGVTEDWDKIEIADGTYDWSELDSKITAAKAAGFKFIALGITWSSFDTPEWLRSELKAAGQTIPLLDPGANHNTYCQSIDVPLYWSPRWHSKRLALIAAAGARYSSDSAIIAVSAEPYGHNSNDWNIQDTQGATGCPPPNDTVDQVAQWLAAGWTRAKMLQIGEEFCDAVALAFPNQCIKLPIGGLADGLANTSPDPLGGPGNYSTLARELTAYVATRPYSIRFYIQRNTVDANWGTAQSLIDNPPGLGSERYIKKMIADAAPMSGLQTVAAASFCVSGQPCRQNGNNVCTSPEQVMQDSLDVILTYKPSFAEVWVQDGINPAFYDMIAQATLAMGGQLRP